MYIYKIPIGNIFNRYIYIYIYSSYIDKCLLKIDFNIAFIFIFRESIIRQVAKYCIGLLN